MTVGGQRPLTTGFDPKTGDLSGARSSDSDMYAREVFGLADWSDMATDIKAKSRVLADDAAFEITNIAQWYHLDDPEFNGVTVDAIRSEFNELWRVMWVAKGIRMFRDVDKAISYEKQIIAPAMSRAIDFLNTNTSFWAPIDSFSDAVSVNSMMRSVIGILARQRTPVIPSVLETAHSIREEFVKLWEGNRWNFRIRHISMVINANGSIDFGGETNLSAFDGFASKYITVLNNKTRSRISWLDSTRFSEAKAYYDNAAVSTGVPKYFFTEDRGATTVIHWAPDPAAAYTAYANIIIKGPQFSANAFDDSDDNGLNSLPQPFRAHLRDIVVAKLLGRWGREDVDAKRAMDQVNFDRSVFIDDWVERGAEASVPVPRAGYTMIREQRSYRGGGGPSFIG